VCERIEDIREADCDGDPVGLNVIFFGQNRTGGCVLGRAEIGRTKLFVSILSADSSELLGHIESGGPCLVRGSAPAYRESENIIFVDPIDWIPCDDPRCAAIPEPE